ncbi:hypothetical protein ABZX95_50515 [Streptomyces sp. NPDC004232]|nr:hypothetical protein [Streptomyces sp. tea 10]
MGEERVLGVAATTAPGGFDVCLPLMGVHRGRTGCDVDGLSGGASLAGL